MAIEFYTEDDLQRAAKARVLITGKPKAGKTVTTLVTAPGPICVINCDMPGAPAGAKRHGAKDLLVCDVTTPEDWRQAVPAACKLANDGEVKSIVVDTVTTLVNHILGIELGKRYKGFDIWREVVAAMGDGLNQLLKADAHVFILSHYNMEDGQLMLHSQLKTTVPALVHDRVHLEFDPKRKPSRVFHIGPSASGISGGRSSDESKIIEADIGLLLEELGIEP